MNEKKISTSKYNRQIEELETQGKTVMILADKQIIGFIAVADTIRETSAEAVKQLQKLGLEVYMITGDNKRTAKEMSKKGLAISEGCSENKPKFSQR